MTRLGIFLFGVLFVSSLFAQEVQNDFHYHQAKSSTFSLGVGIPSTTQIAVEFVSLIDQDAKASPQFTLRYEYAINDKIGIGAYGGYYTGETSSISLPSIQLDSILNDPGSVLGNLFGNNDDLSSTYSVNVLTLGGFFTYHFFKFEKLDTYTIVRGGYNNVSITENGIMNIDFLGVDVPQIEYFAGVGARYYFTPNFGVYGEVGNSILSPVHVVLGATARF